MIKFIKLTEANGRRCTLLLNAANISAIQSGNSTNTYIRLLASTIDKEGKLKNDYYFVEETLEQIEEMLK